VRRGGRLRCGAWKSESKRVRFLTPPGHEARVKVLPGDRQVVGLPSFHVSLVDCSCVADYAGAIGAWQESPEPIWYPSLTNKSGNPASQSHGKAA
jgi:hypothetical protein